VRPTVVQQEDIQALRECLGEAIEEELAHVRMYIWPFEEASVPRGGLDRTIDIEPREDMVDAPDRLDAARGEAPPPDGEYTKAALVLATHPDGAPVRGWDHPLEWLMTGGLERRNRLRLFVCDWAEPLCAWLGSAHAPGCRAFYL
jgi:hypothetical protein